MPHSFLGATDEDDFVLPKGDGAANGNGATGEKGDSATVERGDDATQVEDMDTAEAEPSVQLEQRSPSPPPSSTPSRFQVRKR